jgi:uncharacterized coiled-coil protein SlyX
MRPEHPLQGIVRAHEQRIGDQIRQIARLEGRVAEQERIIETIRSLLPAPRETHGDRDTK